MQCCRIERLMRIVQLHRMETTMMWYLTTPYRHSVDFRMLLSSCGLPFSFVHTMYQLQTNSQRPEGGHISSNDSMLRHQRNRSQTSRLRSRFRLVVTDGTLSTLMMVNYNRGNVRYQRQAVREY